MFETINYNKVNPVI